MERVRQVFEEQFERGLHPGAQLVVMRHRQVLLDCAAGTADLRRRDPVRPDTPFLVFSVTKAFTGICVHHLIEKGMLEMDAPVAEYWPEFGCKGKQQATLRHVFLHQAGVPKRGLYRQILRWPWPKAVSRLLANLPAEFSPGSKTAYHTVNYGFILGEVVRRVSGLPVAEYLQRHFLDPLGLKDTWLGLPPSERSRAAGLYSGHRENLGAVTVFRQPWIRSASIPAATLNSTARDLAVFYQMLLDGGEYAGRRYLEPETIHSATSLGYEGFDETIGLRTRWAYGFHLGGKITGGPAHYIMGKGSSLDTFGHFGMGTCMAWADRRTGTVAAFTCSRLLHHLETRRRWVELNDAIWEAIGE